MSKKSKEDKEAEKEKTEERKRLIKLCKQHLDKSHRYSEHFTAQDLIYIVNAFLYLHYLSSKEVEDICRIEHKKYFDLSDILK